ncbi:MAG: glycoside hydrolase family 1 protein [Candidatus Colwellbacteria bacterium]|nr:glycoside hydrolase family 1 protein [Candidatus Colwellbacteria bacterium]
MKTTGRDFFWGSATSAHQIEGGNHNDWSEWELKSAKVEAQNAEKKNWPEYILKTYPNPLQEKNYISGAACDHYNRFREDFDIAKSLGHNAHRFSIEWSRIEPEEGKFNEQEIEHYREVIRALRKRGMEPFVTLWHWTLPVWFSERGGWLHPQAGEAFTRFVSRIVDEYKDDVRFWGVYNEPETFARHGYFRGDRPPGYGWRIFSYYRVLKVLVETYIQTYKAIKKIDSKAQVGISESLVYFNSYSRMPLHLIALRIVRWWRNNPFLEEYIAHSDYIGFQYYFHSRIRRNPWKSQWGIQYNENKSVSDFGWEIYPEGIYQILKQLGKYHKPIYITENGLADSRDEKRANFIKEHIRYTRKAVSEGVDVRGYFHWSLLDNFEWNKGFWPRFGLVEIDYRTLERKVRGSALEYKKIINTETKK